MKKTYLIILGVVTILCVVFGALWNFGVIGTRGGSSVLSGESGSFSGGDQSLAAFTEISVDVDVADVTIREGESYGIEMSWSDSSLEPEYSVSGGVLRVRQKKGVRVTRMNTRCDIVIVIPGDLSRIILKSDVGNCTIDGASASSCSVESNVGNCTVRGGSFAALDAESDTGNIRIENVAFDSCTAKSDVGNVRIQLPSAADRNAYTVSMETDLGSVHAFGSSYKHAFSQRGTDSAKRIRASSDVGNVRVE